MFDLVWVVILNKTLLYDKLNFKQFRLKNILKIIFRYNTFIEQLQYKIIFQHHFLHKKIRFLNMKFDKKFKNPIWNKIGNIKTLIIILCENLTMKKTINAINKVFGSEATLISKNPSVCLTETYWENFKWRFCLPKSIH